MRTPAGAGRVSDGDEECWRGKVPGCGGKGSGSGIWAERAGGATGRTGGEGCGMSWLKGWRDGTELGGLVWD